MSIFSKLKKNHLQNAVVDLVEKMAKDSNFVIEPDKRIYESDSFDGLSKTVGRKAYVIKSADGKSAVEIVQDFHRATGTGTKGLYALIVNGKKQEVDQSKLKNLFDFIDKQKSDARTKGSKQHQEELMALLQRYTHE